MIHLLRHAEAGDRHRWERIDSLRPLSPVGHRQAEAIAEEPALRSTVRILSSPATRCVQTVEPLAARLGLEVETSAALAEGTMPEATFGFLKGMEGPTVACSHGDIVGNLLRIVASQGADLGEGPTWPKGSIWEMRLEQPACRYLPPPAISPNRPANWL